MTRIQSGLILATCFATMGLSAGCAQLGAAGAVKAGVDVAMSRAINRYCSLPAGLRAIERDRVNGRIAPNRIELTCATGE